ncbi:MAG: outer membrane beta-barrel protein [Ginsengibacter sp.]
MDENRNHIDDMQKLAEEGWRQMHESLRQRGLTSDLSIISAPPKRRNVSLLFAACIFFFLIFTYPFILNDSFYFSSNQKTNTKKSVLRNTVTAKKPGNIIAVEGNKSPMLTSQQKHFFHQKINATFLQSENKTFEYSFGNEDKYLLQNVLTEKVCQVEILKSANSIDTIIKMEKTISLQKKSTNSFSKKVELYAGAGINISSAGNNFANSFNFKNLNIHPSVTVIIPLTRKLSLHTGLSAFSTIQGKEVSAQEKELVNNLSSNVYYNINTTSIIKASYFDLPLTLHYSINKSWSVGSGLQLSRLDKVKIKEESESFDYNNRLYSATVNQYSASPMVARAAFEKKLEIKKMEPRFIVETNLQQGRFLFSAGYYYSLEKSIILKEDYNSSRQYRNEYFKLGIQYRFLGGK